jgi:putative heme-binding domain-containing protein
VPSPTEPDLEAQEVRSRGATNVPKATNERSKSDFILRHFAQNPFRRQPENPASDSLKAQGTDPPVSVIIGPLMRRLSCLLPLLLSGLPASGQEHLVLGTEALSPGEELAGFTVAEGFKVDLFAAEPLINKPINPAAADPGRGKALFATQCAACHRLDGEGGLVGPQLDGIGSRGLERLAEDILDPNRNVDAHFRLTRLVLRDSTVLGGFVAGESGEVLHLLDPAGQTRRVRIAEIRTRETTALSLMPPAFGEVLQPDDFRDLAAWLLGRK